MYADIEELAAEHRLELRRRREAGEQRRDEFVKSRAPESTNPDIVHRASTGLVYKDRPRALVEPAAARASTVANWDGFTERQLEILGMTVSEIRREMRTHVEAAVGKFEREIAVLQKELALERGFQALKAEIAAAKGEIPRVPEIEARVNASHAELKREQGRLQRELARTKDRVSKMRVDQSITDHELQKHIKQSAPVVELHFQTSQNSFVVRDLHADAAAAWRDFCNDLASEQQNHGASLRVVDPTSPTGLVVGLPVRKSSYAA